MIIKCFMQIYLVRLFKFTHYANKSPVEANGHVNIKMMSNNPLCLSPHVLTRHPPLWHCLVIHPMSQPALFMSGSLTSAYRHPLHTNKYLSLS